MCRRDYGMTIVKLVAMGIVGGMITSGLAAPFWLGIGVPFGWSLITKIFPFGMIGFSPAALTYLGVKFMASCLLGIVAMPVVLAYNVVQCVRCTC